MVAWRLLIFAKEPQSGRVKTRIANSMGNDYATLLAGHLLNLTQILANEFTNFNLKVETENSALKSPTRSVHWYGAPDIRTPFWQKYIKPQHYVHQQAAGDLGQRLEMAVKPWLAQGDYVVCIGMDCPMLDCGHLHAAFSALSQGDAVLQPAIDGGFVLLGLGQWHSGLFENIAWSTEQVFQQMQCNFKKYKFSCVIKEKLKDIDLSQDIPPEIDAVIQLLLKGKSEIK